MLNSLKSHLPVALFSIFYIVVFTTIFVVRGDYEFLWYVAVLVIIAALVLATLHRSKFDNIILWGLSIWGLLHMAGGGVPVGLPAQAGDGVLYGAILAPLFDGGGEFVLLKYDQAVHFFGFAVATLVAYHLLRPYLKGGVNRVIIVSIAALAGMGLGVVNEIVEFIAVVVIPDTGVGGYFNTALDLVFNTLGAIAAALYLAFYREDRVYAPRHGSIGARIKRLLTHF